MYGHVVFCSKDLTNDNSLLFMQRNTEVRDFHNVVQATRMDLLLELILHSRCWSVYMN